MGYVARLESGSNKLDISTGRYKLADFVPPTTQETAQYTTGTSANRRGGGDLIGRRGANSAFAFGLQIWGTTSAEIERAIADVESFLRLAGDETAPLYFVWSPNTNVGFSPIWGQYERRVEIVNGTLAKTAIYGVANLRETKYTQIGVSLVIKPYVLGQQQQLGNATGGVIEDTIGTTDGISRGLIIPEATTNKMTNPVFGYSTWSNGWTTGADLISSQNIDKQFLPDPSLGISSAKLVAINDIASLNFTQSINVGNTNSHTLSCYAKRPDGSAVTSSDVKLLYSDAKNTTYTSVGDGWYRLSWTGAGINAATATGIFVVAKGRSIYVTGFQMEEKGYVTPFCFGDMLGCSWSGTRHASTSVRTVAAYILDDSIIDMAEGTIRLVWRSDFANTHASNMYLLTSATSAFTLVYNVAATNQFALTDGTNTVNGNYTLAANTTYVLHVVWGAGKLQLYVNGSNLMNGATYTPAAMGNMYVGSTSAPASHADGTFNGLKVWRQAMSATEITNDYNNVASLVTDNQRVDCIPWLWTKDGDGIVDNCDDSTRDNWFVCQGIPGSLPAKTEYLMTLSAAMTTIQTVWLNNLDAAKFIIPTTNLYLELSGSADTTCSGEAFEALTVDTAADAPASDTLAFLPEYYTEIAGREYNIFVRASDTGSNLQIQSGFGVGGNWVTSDWGNVSSDSAYRLYRLSPLITYPVSSALLALAQNYRGVFYPNFIRTSGSAPVNLDYFELIFRPLIRIRGPSSGNAVYLCGRDAAAYATATNNVLQDVVLSGDIIELIPERYNHQHVLMGDTDFDPVTTYTATMVVNIYPRWLIL